MVNKPRIKYILPIFILTFLPVFLGAAFFKIGENYSLQRGEQINDDAYVVGKNIAIAGDVKGDLLTGGVSVFVGEEVSRDAFVIGRKISVIGSIGENLRMAGGNIVVSSNVGRDIAAVGGTISILPNSIIEGGVFLMGGDVSIDGIVEKDLQFIGGKIEINGHIKGDVVVTGDMVVVGDEAIIEGDFTYSVSKPITISDSAIVNGEIIEKGIGIQTFQEKFLPTLWNTWILIKFIVLLV